VSNRIDGLITAEKFSELSGISLNKVINMIRDGFFSGEKIDGNWFISEDELKSNGNNTLDSIDITNIKITSIDIDPVINSV